MEYQPSNFDERDLNTVPTICRGLYVHFFSAESAPPCLAIVGGARPVLPISQRLELIVMPNNLFQFWHGSHRLMEFYHAWHRYHPRRKDMSESFFCDHIDVRPAERELFTRMVELEQRVLKIEGKNQERKPERITTATSRA